MKKRFIVSMDEFPGVTNDELTVYIFTALTRWRYGGDPNNPIMEMNEDSVMVSLLGPDDMILSTAGKGNGVDFFRGLISAFIISFVALVIILLVWSLNGSGCK